MTITYTFPATLPFAALRGVTVTGGRFERRSVDGALIDVCVFETLIDGRSVMAKVSGKPELEAALAAQKLAEEQAAANKRAALEAAVPGLAEWVVASTKYSNAAYAYDRACSRSGGYPSYAAAAAKDADAALQAVYAAYPKTALWAQIESFSLANHWAKSSAGNTAKAAVHAGADIVEAVAAMEANWSAAAARAVDNS